MPRNLHRGPRLVPAKPLPDEPGKRILMQEVLGRVAWIIRRGLNASQQQIADQIGLPPSTVSKLEMGNVSMAVHHLDSLAGAFTFLDEELRGERAEAWEGWELHRIADEIADGLSERGYAVIWLRPDLVEDEELFTRGKQLVALMKECWPDALRRRP